MTNYLCSRCNKVFGNKYKFNQHVNRKFPCKQIESQTNVNEQNLSANNILSSTDIPSPNFFKFGNNEFKYEINETIFWL